MGRTRVRRSPPPDICDTAEEVAAFYDQVEDPHWEPDYDPADAQYDDPERFPPPPPDPQD